MLSKLKDVVFAWWFITLLIVIALSVVLWFVAPVFVPLLGSAALRLAGISALVLLWLVGILAAWVATRQARRLLKQIESEAQSEPPPETARPAADLRHEAADADVAALRSGLEQALQTLRRNPQGGLRRSLYELPWYVMIGPPGSGKTTALLNSGLHFPLADQFGRNAIKGVGGTRDCDWWFTDQAILLDTAGRYTTRESDEQVDTAGWLGFLELLRRYRPRQPINGILVAISLADLARLSAEESRAHAAAVKARIRELYDTFGIRFPVYVVFTKADLVAGFMEFFDDLDRDGRKQVWGATFALGDAERVEGRSARFEQEFDVLLKQLNAQLIRRLEQERDPERRGLIFGFPRQFATLRAPIKAFLDEAFLPNRFEESILLRGFYVTSGTQEGAPIDRLMASLSATFGIERAELPTAKSKGRSYFLTDLLTRLIFPEAALARPNLQATRRLTLLFGSAIIACCVASIAMAALWYQSYAANRRLVQGANTAISAYEAALQQGKPALAPTTADVTAVLPPLDALRRMPGGYDTLNTTPPFSERLGLYQGSAIRPAAVVAYYRALNRLLLPRLLARLKAQLHQNMDDPQALFSALEVYLMLGHQGPLDTGTVQNWFAADWQRSYPGADDAPLRRRLQRHLDALLQGGLETYPLDQRLIGDSRAKLTRVPLALRTYRALLVEPVVAQLPPWRLIDHAGPAASEVLMRRSGAPLSAGIPGAFTVVGFHKIIEPQLPIVAKRATAEEWVVNPNAPPAADAKSVASLSSDVLTLYLDDYVRRWDALLSDVTIVPFSSTPQMLSVLNALAGPRSPLREALTAISTETTLVTPAAAAAGNAAAAAQQAATAKLAGAAAPLAHGLLGGASPASNQPPPWKYVDDHFADLHQFVGGNPPPLDDLIKGIAAAYKKYSALANSNDSAGQLLKMAGDPNSSGTPLRALLWNAGNLPAPINQVVADMAASGDKLAAGGVHNQLDALWTTQVLPQCRAVVAQNFPFDPSSTKDAPPADFAKLFAPGGLIDHFFTANLQNFVDTQSDPWQWRNLGGSQLGLSSASLTLFQAAARIRDSFFENGHGPTVTFTITPKIVDPSIDRVILTIGKQTIAYSHGPVTPEKLTWPDSAGNGTARITFLPSVAGAPSTLAHDGVWGWLHILNQARIQPTSDPTTFIVTFTLGGRRASFQIRVPTTQNPFDLRALQQFQCLSSLS